VELKINKALDPDRSKLRARLQTQFDYERIRSARVLFVHLAAVTGALIWLNAVWPGLFSEDMRFFTVTVWAAIAGIAVFAAVEECIWRRKLARLISEQHGE
jgi:hypothetical protein